MGNPICPASSLLISLFLACVGEGQEQALERMKNESARLREAAPPSDSDFAENMKAVRTRSGAFHTAVRDWIESLLPKSRPALDSGFPLLNTRIDAELQHNRLIGSSWTGEDFTLGLVSRVALSRPREDLNKLAVTVGVGVPCGSDEAVYVYDYSHGLPRRILESHGTQDHDESVSDVRFSSPDAGGNQLILTLRYGVQCASTWNLLSYDLFRWSTTANMAVSILSGEHGIWFGDEHPYQLRLDPEELLMEVRDRSIDADIHNRIHVLHFTLAKSAVVRTDPVALQPQDFVDEWLTRPWSEMESRSADGAREKLKLWHEFLSGDFVAGEFTMVQACRDKPNQWQVGINLNWIRGKELPEPFSAFFLVKRMEQYRFEMVGINSNRQEGCPGESRPSTESPSLFPKGF
jgi:hypothetical protein